MHGRLLYQISKKNLFYVQVAWFKRGNLLAELNFLWDQFIRVIIYRWCIYTFIILTLLYIYIFIFLLPNKFFNINNLKMYNLYKSIKIVLRDI